MAIDTHRWHWCGIDSQGEMPCTTPSPPPAGTPRPLAVSQPRENRPIWTRIGRGPFPFTSFTATSAAHRATIERLNLGDSKLPKLTCSCWLYALLPPHRTNDRGGPFGLGGRNGNRSSVLSRAVHPDHPGIHPVRQSITPGRHPQTRLSLPAPRRGVRTLQRFVLREISRASPKHRRPMYAGAE